MQCVKNKVKKMLNQENEVLKEIACIKPMTKTVINPVILLLYRCNYSRNKLIPFLLVPLKPPQGPSVSPDHTLRTTES